MGRSSRSEGGSSESANVKSAPRLQAGYEPIPGYRLKQLVGQGGIAEVWEATAPDDGPSVAMKFMHVTDGINAGIEIRTLQSMQGLLHPKLLRIHQVWSLPSHVVISMDLADGSLQDILFACLDEYGTPLPPADACQYLAQAAEAIDFLNSHQHFHDGKRVGFQHGDIKPSNMLVFGDTVKLADFGLAVPMTQARSQRVPKSTIEFAAAEVFQGCMTDQSDQYSLAISYCLLRGGRLPFTDSPRSFQVPYKRPTPDLTMLLEVERPVIARALSPSPISRWPSCWTMMEALAEALRRKDLVRVSSAAVLGREDFDRIPSTMEESKREFMDKSSQGDGDCTPTDENDKALFACFESLTPALETSQRAVERTRDLLLKQAKCGRPADAVPPADAQAETTPPPQPRVPSLLGLSTKPPKPAEDVPLANAQTQIKLPPLVGVKPKPSSAAELKAAPATRVDLGLQNASPEELVKIDVAPDAPSREANVSSAADQAVQKGGLMAWSETGAVPKQPDAPIDEKADQPQSQQKTDVGGIVPHPATYEVFSFLTPCEKPGYLGCVSKFRVRELIGEGGMGYVFLAEDKYLKRPVALKVMKQRLAKKKRSWGWFVDEARATSALQSDRMATIYEIGEYRGGLYLAMELLYGESLEARLKRAALPLELAFWVAQETAHGLALVHRIGICHRDIKPANLWLSVPRNFDLDGADVLRTYGDRKTWTSFNDTEYTSVKILDFGLARLKAGGRGRQKRGAVVGTPCYMAPEQGRGELGDARSDLFSFGVVLYRMLSGCLPFSGDNAFEVLSAMATDTPMPLWALNSTIPRALSDLTMQLLSFKPEERPESAFEVADRLQTIEKMEAAETAAQNAKTQSKSSVWRRIFGG
jgi:serine/threonine protein kinase